MCTISWCSTKAEVLSIEKDCETVEVSGIRLECVTMARKAWLVLLCLSSVLLASAERPPLLRVPLKRRALELKNIQAARAALQAKYAGKRISALRGEPEEADIPLLDFLDAQCATSPSSYKFLYPSFG
jgi:hypothetical protein